MLKPDAKLTQEQVTSALQNISKITLLTGDEMDVINVSAKNLTDLSNEVKEKAEQEVRDNRNAAVKKKVAEEMDAWDKTQGRPQLLQQGLGREDEANDQKKYGKMIKIGLAIVALLITIGGGYFALKGGRRRRKRSKKRY